MLSDKVKREIDASLANVVNENEMFKKYLLAGDSEYLEEKLKLAYQLWYKLAQIQYNIARNAISSLTTHEMIRKLKLNKVRVVEMSFDSDELYKMNLECLEAQQRELKWIMEDLYDEAVRYLKRYDLLNRKCGVE